MASRRQVLMLEGCTAVSWVLAGESIDLLAGAGRGGGWLRLSMPPEVVHTVPARNAPAGAVTP
jgi:hypothetical protein